MLPDEPMTRTERYLARLAGQDVSIPDTPITREEQYLAYIIQNGGGVPAPNAGAHNAIFRGKNLGSTYTQAQADAIDAGTFDDLYVGDYWEMPWGESETPVKFRIAGFDCYYGMGNAPFNQHHAIIIPDSELGTAAYYTSGDASNGYISSDVRNVFLAELIPILQSMFLSGLLTRKSSLLNTPGGRAWADSTLDLLNCSQISNQTVTNANMGERSLVLPLFSLNPRMAGPDTYMLCDINSATTIFARFNSGVFTTVSVNDIYPVRPYFCLGKAPTP